MFDVVLKEKVIAAYQGLQKYPSLYQIEEFGLLNLPSRSLKITKYSNCLLLIDFAVCQFAKSTISSRSIIKNIRVQQQDKLLQEIHSACSPDL